MAGRRKYLFLQISVMKGAGLPDFVVEMIAEMQQSIRKGALDIESSDFEKLLGRPTTPIDKALTEIVDGIRSNVYPMSRTIWVF